jgi:protein pelota
MKIIKQDLRNGEIVIKVENLDDLWYLSHIIDKDDIIKGKTIRKIKIGNQEDRKSEVIKKTIFIKLKAEKIEFTEDQLRVSGKIIEGPEDIPLGSYHAFEFEENTIATIEKESWLKFQLDKLKEASKEKQGKIMIVVLDREEALFALIQREGYKLLTTIKGDVNKKAVEEKNKSNFYGEIIKQIQEYNERYSLSQIILASPIFWKEELIKELKDSNLKKKIIQATCSSADTNGINEVIKRPETQEALHQDRISQEINIVEELLSEISKNNLAVYGIKPTEDAVNSGAVRTLIITDNFIKKQREKENYKKIDQMLKNTESMKGNVIIISSEHEGGRKLDGLSGIAALLRYKLSY